MNDDDRNLLLDIYYNLCSCRARCLNLESILCDTCPMFLDKKCVFSFLLPCLFKFFEKKGWV